jgi:hypothetical protein
VPEGLVCAGKDEQEGDQLLAGGRACSPHQIGQPRVCFRESKRGNRPEYPDRPEYLVVPSGHVAAKVEKYAPKGGTVWYTFMRANRLSGNEGWEIFGNAHAPADAADEAEVIDEV